MGSIWISVCSPWDAIPGIDEPSFGTEYFGDNDDDVIIVESDPPRAYPVRILSYHEIVNDVLEGPRESRKSAPLDQRRTVNSNQSR